MNAFVAKDLAHGVGEAIDDGRLLGEVICAVDKPDHLPTTGRSVMQ